MQYSHGRVWHTVLPRGALEYERRHEKAPALFEDIEFQSPRSEEEPTVQLPEMLPANYEVLRDENEIKEEKPPNSCPCFRDDRDPDGRLRHLAGLILH